MPPFTFTNAAYTWIGFCAGMVVATVIDNRKLNTYHEMRDEQTREMVAAYESTINSILNQTPPETPSEFAHALVNTPAVFYCNN